MSITVSQHAKERYAQRIMGRDNCTDVAVFIRDHSQKIVDDIGKMIEFGEMIYSGKSVRDTRQDIAVYINGSWVVILDTNASKVITLYNIDLGVGEEVNKAFISEALKNIHKSQDALKEALGTVTERLAQYQTLIADAEATVSQYRRLIKSTEAQIEAYRGVIKTLNVDIDVADHALRESVEILIGKQHF